MLAGPRDFISQAVRCRKALGGGMRQAGILAAAGKIALLDMAGRLEEDHHNAKTFAQGEHHTFMESRPGWQYCLIIPSLYSLPSSA